MTATNGWVRTNINFDLPGRTFTVGARKLVVLGLASPNKDDLEALAAWATITKRKVTYRKTILARQIQKRVDQLTERDIAAT